MPSVVRDKTAFARGVSQFVFCEDKRDIISVYAKPIAQAYAAHPSPNRQIASLCAAIYMLLVDATTGISWAQTFSDALFELLTISQSVRDAWTSVCVRRGTHDLLFVPPVPVIKCIPRRRQGDAEVKKMAASETPADPSNSRTPLCSVCRERASRIMLFPCAHASLCCSCYTSMHTTQETMQCPVCRDIPLYRCSVYFP